MVEVKRLFRILLHFKTYLMIFPYPKLIPSLNNHFRPPCSFFYCLGSVHCWYMIFINSQLFKTTQVLRKHPFSLKNCTPLYFFSSPNKTLIFILNCNFYLLFINSKILEFFGSCHKWTKQHITLYTVIK